MVILEFVLNHMPSHEQLVNLDSNPSPQTLQSGLGTLIKCWKTFFCCILKKSKVKKKTTKQQQHELFKQSAANVIIIIFATVTAFYRLRYELVTKRWKHLPVLCTYLFVSVHMCV